MRSNYLFLAIVFLVTVLFTILVPFDRDSLSAHAQQSDPCSGISFPYTLPISSDWGNLANINQAIDCANTNPNTTEHIIDLNGQTITLTNWAETREGGNGLKSIRSNITVRNGELRRQPSAIGMRMFYVRPRAYLQLENITLRNGGHGNFSYDGGAIYNEGTLTISNSTITGSKTTYGAAIYNQPNSTLTINNSVISGNHASEFGGAIRSRGTIVINNSTIAGNYARVHGGGVSSAEGNVTITLIRG
jgi:predicted outer membrane repeat protein